MDRAMVHISGEGKKFNYLVASTLGGWFVNIPFEEVPESFIRQIARDPVTPYEKYLEYCPWLNSLPNVWNCCLINKDKVMLAFGYGDYDPILSHMQVIRFSIQPKLFRVNSSFAKEILEVFKAHAKSLGVEKIYWISCQWRAFLRKTPEDLKLKDTRVMEVLNV